MHYWTKLPFAERPKPMFYRPNVTNGVFVWSTGGLYLVTCLVGLDPSKPPLKFTCNCPALPS